MRTGSKQFDPRSIRPNCIALRVRLINRVITKIYDNALRPFGLRVPQFAMLAFAEEHGVLRQADICAELQLDDSTLSRNLDRMRRRGWLVDTVGDDARERLYQITPQGREVLSQAMPAWIQAQTDAKNLVGSRGINALRSIAENLGLKP